MSKKTTPSSASSVDRLMQEMSLQPNLPLAPDPTPGQPAGAMSSPRDARVQEVMDRFGLTREQAIQELAAFGF